MLGRRRGPSARAVWLSAVAALIGVVVLACAVSIVSQLVTNLTTGTSRPGHTLSSMPSTRRLLAAMRAHIDEAAASSCGFDASRERAALERVIRHADKLGLEAAAAASLATLLTACTKQTSCAEPSELGDVLLRSWRDAVGEWREMDCMVAGALAEEGLARGAFDGGGGGGGVCGEAPWPRMLAAALLSAAPCVLPAARAAHLGPFRILGDKGMS